jgi:hypothetical protein
VPRVQAPVPSAPEAAQKQRVFKVASSAAPPPPSAPQPSAAPPSAAQPSAPQPSAAPPSAAQPSAQKQRVFKIASQPVAVVEEAKEPEPEPEQEAELPSVSVQQPQEVEESKEELATVEERENEAPLFEFENENENETEEQKVEPEPQPQPEPEPLPAPLPAQSKKRVFKIATAPISVLPSATVLPSAKPETKTMMTVAKTLANLHTADVQLEDTIGSMDGDRQKYDISFPVEEEELAKLDSQFKTLKIRPSGLSAVPGPDFEENQQTLARLMREAELEEQQSKVKAEGYETLETPTEESKNESSSRLSN